MLVSFLRQLFGGRRPGVAAGGRQPIRSTPEACLEALQLGRLDMAAECFRAHLAAHPDDADAHINFGVALQQLGRYSEALARFETATRLVPTDPTAWYNVGVIHHLLGDLARAESCYLSAIEADPAYPEAHREYSMLRLGHGDFSAVVWSSFRHRRRCAGFELTVSRCPAPLWTGEPLEERTVLAYGEQGLGDEILFASCYPDLIARSQHCVIETEPRLEGLFRRSFPGATVFGRHREAELAVRYSSVAYKVPCGDLPRYFRSSAGTFAGGPYLTAHSGAVERWRRTLADLGPGLNIGISWRGGTARTNQAIRSASLDQWGAVFRVPDAHFVSLQYGDCRDDLAYARNSLGVNLHHWPEAIDDYDETAALVSALDVVVTVTTSVAHLAGALGQRVWILAIPVPRWCYMGSGPMPWYSSARLFRQKRSGIWDEVMVRAAQALEELRSPGPARPPG